MTTRPTRRTGCPGPQTGISRAMGAQKLRADAIFLLQFDSEYTILPSVHR